MRIAFRSLVPVILFGALFSGAAAQNGAIFTQTLVLGSSGDQVLALQQFLNRDADTRIADSGAGSPGSETSWFGSLTQKAVIRFQEKYASDVLAPAGLSSGNGRVGHLTRAKLNSLSSTAIAPSTSVASSTKDWAPAAIDYAVKDSEKIDIFAGDAKIAAIQQKISDAINAAITAGGFGTASIPTPTLADSPSVIIKSIFPASGLPGTQMSIVGSGFLANSVVYFGPDYIVRGPERDLSGNLTFKMPSIPPRRYDVVVVTGTDVSNTKTVIVADPRSPSVRIDSVSPAKIKFGDTITITGSGFASSTNIVSTTYQTFRNVPSQDGKTLVVQLAPPILRTAAQVGNGSHETRFNISVENDYGFSNADKTVTMML